MKKTLCFLFFAVALTTSVSAQTPIATLFEDMKKAFEANPSKAIQEQAVEDYVLVSGTGYIANKQQIVNLFKDVSKVDARFQDLKLRQFGNLLIATGREFSVRHYSNGSPDLSTDYLVTYVYEIKDGKLLYVSGQHTVPAAK